MKMRNFLLTMLFLGSSTLFGQALSLTSGVAAPGGTTTLTLNFDAQSNPALPAAMQWTLTYPPNLVISVVPTPGASIVSANKTMTPCAVSSPFTMLCLQVGMNLTPIQSGPIATLAFTLFSGVASNQVIPISIVSQLAAAPDGTNYGLSVTGGTITVPPTPPPPPNCTTYTLTRTPVGPVLVYRNGLLQTSPGDYTAVNAQGTFRPVITPMNWSNTDTAAAVYTRAVPLSFAYQGQTVSYWGYTLYRENWNCTVEIGYRY